MRFEIRGGGTFLILLGLIGLSGVVFALGLVAGFEMGRQTTTETAKAESVYPLPSPPEMPEASPSPAAGTTGSPAATRGTALAVHGSERATPAVSSPAATPALAARPAARGAPNSTKSEAEARATTPSAVTSRAETKARPASAPAASESARSAGATGPATVAGKTSGASSAPSLHRKPYNIQIDALMDRTNAEQMAAKLEKLGYHAFLVPADVDGQTWWRVRVGPYNSAEEATAAEARLRQQYREAEAGGQ